MKMTEVAQDRRSKCVAEIWKPDVSTNIEGLFVSSEGRVRRVPPAFLAEAETAANLSTRFSRHLKPKVTSLGLAVDLRHFGGPVTPIAPMICAAFHGSAEITRRKVVHRNGNRSDLRAGNLAWEETGLLDERKVSMASSGAGQSKARLSEYDKGVLRQLLESGVSVRDAAQTMMCTLAEVSRQAGNA